MTDTRRTEAFSDREETRADREPQFSRREFGLVTGGLLFASTSASAAPEKTLQLSGPVERQVFQRTGYQPAAAHPHAPGGPQRGTAQVPIQGRWSGAVPVKLEARTLLHEGCVGQALDWTALGELDANGEFRRELPVPAGGWYRLEVRTVSAAGETLAMASVDPVGVGEVFVIAGQSYAGGYNDELLKLDDPAARTVRHDWVAQTWQPAHDPFPHVGDGGTLWPAFANALQPVLQVPLGLVNVSVGATASRQWLPGETLYQRFRDGVRNFGRFRFVLWQQGESDVIESIATATYVERIETIRRQLAADLGFAPRWLLAKSTLHPTVYNKPIEEGRIRDAIDHLWRQPGFGRGPDTDLLDGENRGGPQTRRHFSGIGQRRAGLLWFASVWTALQDDSPA